MLRSKQAGELVQCERPKTLADGLRGRMGDLTWPIVRDFVDDVITVSEEQIIDAMQLCFERLKVGEVSLALAESPHQAQVTQPAMLQLGTAV